MMMKTTNIYWVLVAGPTLHGLHALSHLILPRTPWCGGDGEHQAAHFGTSKAKENRRQKYQRINAVTQANREFLFTRAAEAFGTYHRRAEAMCNKRIPLTCWIQFTSWETLWRQLEEGPAWLRIPGQWPNGSGSALSAGFWSVPFLGLTGTLLTEEDAEVKSLFL